jgi:uncharacterized protein (TIGR04255 family)
MSFAIELDESFPHLPRAPIVEAVIHWQARAGRPLDPESLRKLLEERLPEYPNRQAQHEVQLTANKSQADTELTHHARWQGFRLQSDDPPHVVQFTSDGLIFSRLAPYDRWQSFEAEAFRVWDVFVDAAEPAAVQRLGVRFINRIEIAAGDRPDKFLHIAKRPLKGMDLPTRSFLYRDVFTLAGTPYQVRLLRTIQSAEASGRTDALILDVDVHAIEPGSMEREKIAQHLAKMRWLKNKVFFSSITKRAKDLFRKEK